jgi:hypothetical protein
MGITVIVPPGIPLSGVQHRVPEFPQLALGSGLANYFVGDLALGQWVAPVLATFRF